MPFEKLGSLHHPLDDLVALPVKLISKILHFNYYIPDIPYQMKRESGKQTTAEIMKDY